MSVNLQTTYQKLVNPQSIVVVGASANPGKPGGGVTKNLIENQYQGKLYLVNPKSDTIRGLAVHSSIDHLPDNIDLAFIVIPAPFVHDAMQSLIRKNCKTIVVLTAGLGETDEKGKAEEQRLVALANENDVFMIGPNVVGLVTANYQGKFAGILPPMKKGSLDVISGSGATVDYLVEQAQIRGLKFDNIFSMGNSAQHGVEDIIEMLDETHGPDNAVIKLIYMETIKKPEKLLKHARSLTRKGCILIGIKSGVTDSGKRAAASHTGALASSDTAVQALFDKSGIIRVRSKYELVELGCALECLKGATAARNVAIITDAGGPGVMLTDELNKWGVTTPALKASTQQKIAERLPKFATFINPVDCLPTQTAQQIAHVIQSITDEKEDIDAVVVITGNSMLTDKWETYATIIDCMEKRSGVAVLPLLSSVTTCRDLIDKFISHDKTYFVDEVKVGEALGRLHNRPSLYDPESTLANYDKEKLAGILGDFKGVLPADKCTELLDAAGLGRPGQITVFKIEDLSGAGKSINFPLVAKIIGPLHKSDVGGVVAGINNDDELAAAWQRLEQIEGFEGVLLQEMIGGNEIIIGAKKEEGYGHLMLFGLGGIYTEVFKDSQFALAPLGLKESENIIRSIRAVKMLEGVRGQKGMSITRLADQLTRISMLVRDFPQISEIDLNPVKGEGEDLSVVDCRIII